MISLGLKLTLAATVALLTPLMLSACSGDGGGVGTAAQAAVADHGDHAGHEGHDGHEGHEGHGDEAEKAMDGMGGGKVDPADASRSFDRATKPGDKAICPISGEAFVVSEDSEKSEYEGRHYAFCCPGCKPKFDADPAAHADKPKDG